MSDPKKNKTTLCFAAFAWMNSLAIIMTLHKGIIRTVSKTYDVAYLQKWSTTKSKQRDPPYG